LGANKDAFVLGKCAIAIPKKDANSFVGSLERNEVKHRVIDT
jgi:hypothetical protein